MSSPQYPKDSTRPLRPGSYRAAARRLREFADQLDERADPQSPREQASLTTAVHGLSHYAQLLSRRHRRSLSGLPEDES